MYCELFYTGIEIEIGIAEDGHLGYSYPVMSEDSRRTCVG